MANYDCFFDASYKPETSVCAFYIVQNNKIMHKEIKQVKPTKNKNTCNIAELTALHGLLRYIQDYIKAQSTVKIYGDAQGVIQVIRKGKNPKYKEQIQLFSSLKKRHHIELIFIPRAENRKADSLTRCIRKVTREKTFLRNEQICLTDIAVPQHTKYSTPNERKYQNHLKYYNENGRFRKSIKVDEKYNLIDGFIAYSILMELGIVIYDVEVYRVREWAV